MWWGVRFRKRVGQLLFHSMVLTSAVPTTSGLSPVGTTQDKSGTTITVMVVGMQSPMDGKQSGTPEREAMISNALEPALTPANVGGDPIKRWISYVPSSRSPFTTEEFHF
ncbi:hypothetical protein EBR78_04635 [bacterium]|nr:hypothetical protein [bacterium]NBX82561.1 hypothetical protein [bacterium]